MSSLALVLEGLDRIVIGPDSKHPARILLSVAQERSAAEAHITVSLRYHEVEHLILLLRATCTAMQQHAALLQDQACPERSPHALD